jgi:hypothetical protein
MAIVAFQCWVALANLASMSSCITVLALFWVAATSVAAGCVDVAYIATRSISTTLLGSCVIAFRVTAGHIRIAVADYAMAGTVTGLAIFRLAPAFAGAGNSITVLTHAWVAAGAVVATVLAFIAAVPVAAELIRVAATNLTGAAHTGLAQVCVTAANCATGRACGAAVTTATELIWVAAANLAVNADVASFAL